MAISHSVPREVGMASSFTWLDYSEQQRRQMLDVIDMLREQETRDEFAKHDTGRRSLSDAEGGSSSCSPTEGRASASSKRATRNWPFLSEEQAV
jgi:hypothetical protein